MDKVENEEIYKLKRSNLEDLKEENIYGKEYTKEELIKAREQKLKVLDIIEKENFNEKIERAKKVKKIRCSIFYNLDEKQMKEKSFNSILNQLSQERDLSLATSLMTNYLNNEEDLNMFVKYFLKKCKR